MVTMKLWDVDFSTRVVYVIEATVIILNLFILFYEKILSVKKNTKHRTRDFYPLRSLCAQIIVAFVDLCLLIFVLLVGFMFVRVLYARNLFAKKINK